MHQPAEKRPRQGARGFTVVEALVTVMILAVVVVAAVGTLRSSQKMSRSATLAGDSQQSARVAVDLITTDLRTLGFGLEIQSGQRALVHGGPWDLVFNANVLPASDDFLNPGFPRAINPGLANASIPGIYTPTQAFATGAETIRYTLDTNGDGVVDSTDVGDDLEEGTPNPRDFVLVKQVYGELADGTNGGTAGAVGLVAGPLADSGNRFPRPLFSYWIDDDDDPATPEILHGDTNADGVLSTAEIAALTPVAANDLALVTRCVITITAEDGEPTGPGGEYRTRELISSVSFRNQIRRSGIVAGLVFQDSDGDAAYDPSTESPIAGVTVRLDNGQAAVTGASGRYVFQVAAGPYTVTEYDLPGYVSTTVNSHSVNVLTGGVATADFGDRPGSGVGTIQGTVWDDRNVNGTQSGGEPGIAGVVVTLHTGQADTTDSNGFYSFSVPVASYTVVEIDSAGYTSTTTNSVDVTLSVDGEVIVVDFGDVFVGATGTLEGTVYEDTDHDGFLDFSESGIADVVLKVVHPSGQVDSVVTNGSGFYSLNLPTGLYHVAEQDPAGYTSTTPNLLLNQLVMTDSTTTANFGDVLNNPLSFTVVSVGTTNRSLAIESFDMGEDNKGDPDIILGTEPGAGASNLHVWHNRRKNSGTALTALFATTPTFSRTAGAPVQVLLQHDENADGVDDIVTGLDQTTGLNINHWITQTGGGTKGQFNTTADASYSAASGSSVLSLRHVDWPGYGAGALLVGTTDATGVGHVEIWTSTGSPLGYTHSGTGDLFFDARGAFGEISAIAVGDFDGDGTPDLALGQDMGGYAGRVTILTGSPTTPWTWTESSILTTDGAVLAMAAVNMQEDNGGDLDLLVGTSRSSAAGSVELFVNDGTGMLGMIDGATGNRVRDDWIDAGGEVLSIATATLDADVFPDVIVGVRTGTYAGGLSVYQGTGYLPSSGSTWSHTGSGEVVTMTVNDFNIDGRMDVAVGTRTAASSGELVVYFGQ